MIHLPIQPLFAEIGEVIGGLFGLVALVLWVLKQIGDAGKQAQAERGPAPGAPQEAKAPPQVGPVAAGQQADPLRNQVEEFLRRAGRAPQANQRRAGAPSEIEVLVDEEPRPERRQLAEPLRRVETRPAATEQSTGMARPVAGQNLDQRPQRRSVVPRKRKSLAERANERVAARADKLAEQSSHLGQRIIQEDAQFDVQLKAKFDHTVGTLTGSAVTAAEQAASIALESTTPAAMIAAMLASPDGVRQAIVVNEILRPPSERW